MPSSDTGGVGIGLRQPHYDAMLGQPPRLGFVEVHSENFFADGGAALAVLHAARAHWPVSLHGVGLSLGSAAGLDDWHLRAPGATGAAHRAGARQRPCQLRPRAARSPAPRRCMPTTCCRWPSPKPRSTSWWPTCSACRSGCAGRSWWRTCRPTCTGPTTRCAEPEFFNALARRSGCGLLLDLNNLVVNALNDGVDEVAAACAWVDAIDPAIVGEIHLAGYHDAGDIVIDDHGSRVHGNVWQVYRHALRRLGPRPTLIEWDTALPELAVLLDEAASAARQLAACRDAVAA